MLTDLTLNGAELMRPLAMLVPTLASALAVAACSDTSRVSISVKNQSSEALEITEFAFAQSRYPVFTVEPSGSHSSAYFYSSDGSGWLRYRLGDEPEQELLLVPYAVPGKQYNCRVVASDEAVVGGCSET